MTQKRKAKPEPKPEQEPQSQPENLNPSENESQSPEKTTAPATSSEATPDWDSISTPEDMAAELEAEAEAQEEYKARAEFDKVAKKGAHLILGATYMGAQFGVKMKTGVELKSLDPATYGDALEQAAHCAYELADIEPESWIGKVLNFAGNIDERYMPILLLGKMTAENVKAEIAELSEQLEEEKAPTEPEAPIEETEPTAPPPSKLEVVQ